MQTEGPECMDKREEAKESPLRSPLQDPSVSYEGHRVSVESTVSWAGRDVRRSQRAGLGGYISYHGLVRAAWAG